MYDMNLGGHLSKYEKGDSVPRPTITTAVYVDENVRKRYIYDLILAVNHPFCRDCITAVLTPRRIRQSTTTIYTKNRPVKRPYFDDDCHIQ